MKKKSCFTRTDLGGSSALKRTESDLCWKRTHRTSGIDPFKGDEEPHNNSLNVYQQLTRSYSWLKQNVFHSPDSESVVISNKKIKHVLKEFNNNDFVVQRLAMDDNISDSGKSDFKDFKMQDPMIVMVVSPENDEEKVGETKPDGDAKEKGEDGTALLTGDESSEIKYNESAGLRTEEQKGSLFKPKSSRSRTFKRRIDSNPENPITRDHASVDLAQEGAVVEENKSQAKVDQGSKSQVKPDQEDKSQAKMAQENKSQTKVGEGNKEEGASTAEKSEEKLFTLSEADQRAKNMAAFIEKMRASLAEYAKKEEMTQEDAEEMLRKQEELMAKLTEFEEITKQVQDLAGIENISSALLGPPVQCREIKPCGPSPLDSFPKVICFDRISQNELGVPNMIVCEPVCKEKDPCAEKISKPNSKRSPCTDQRIPTNQAKTGFHSDNEAEQYIQNDISGDFPSTEVLGMLEPEMMGHSPVLGTPMVGRQMQQLGMMGPQPDIMDPQPGMIGAQPGMIGPQIGMIGANPWIIGPQQGRMDLPPGTIVSQPGIVGLQPGMMGLQPAMMGSPPGMMSKQPAMMAPPPGMMSPQPGMMGSHPGMLPRKVMMGPQPSIRGPQEQSETLGPQPQAFMVAAQGQLKVLDLQTEPKMVVLKESSDKIKMVPDDKEVQQDISEITIRQQELISVQTKIVNQNQAITEESETDRIIETNIDIFLADKLKTGTERPPHNKQTGGVEKDMINCLKEKIGSLQSEIKDVKAENKDLQKRVLMTSPEATKQMGGTGPQPHLQIPQQPLGGIGQGKCAKELTEGKVACRRNILKQLGISEEERATKDMETMVSSMEDEVRAMKEEISNMQEERRQLEIQKNLLNCTAPAIASQSGKGVPMSTPFSVGSNQESKGAQLAIKTAESDVPYNVMPPLRDLREQYTKLHQDYKLKVEEVSMLRVELESARRESMISIEKSEEAEERVDNLIARLKAVEDEKSKINSNKDQMIELEQQLVLAKQRYKEINEEIDELRSQLIDQTMQTDDYRKKFLNAQQSVEEQRRQIEMMELESSRFGEQVTIELQRVKAQFQTKLEEMAPLPELLKKTQEKFKETVHLKTLAEKNCLILSQNLEIVSEQKEKLKEHLNEINKNKSESEAEKASLKINLTDGEKKMEETKAENNKLRKMVSQLEELVFTNERKYEEKVQEGLQLQSQLETLREESARQVARTKDRYENLRKSLQNQIFELENELASTRASAKSAQKDRDDIRQMMQAQIIQLKENFEQAQMRICSLQSHVNYLKTSYTNIFAPSDKSENELILQ